MNTTIILTIVDEQSSDFGHYGNGRIAMRCKNEKIFLSVAAGWHLQYLQRAHMNRACMPCSQLSQALSAPQAATTCVKLARLCGSWSAREK